MERIVSVKRPSRHEWFVSTGASEQKKNVGEEQCSISVDMEASCGTVNEQKDAQAEFQYSLVEYTKCNLLVRDHLHSKYDAISLDLPRAMKLVIA